MRLHRLPASSVPDRVDIARGNAVVFGERSRRGGAGAYCSNVSFGQLRKHTAMLVYGLGHGFEVTRVHAARHAAEMVDHESFGYLSHELPVGLPMDVIVAAEHPDLRVSASYAALPYPARGLVPGVSDLVVARQDDRGTLPSGEVALGEPRRFPASARAELCRHLRVASLREVVRRGWRTRNPLASFYALTFCAALNRGGE